MKDNKSNQTENSRRQALKAITAASGGIVVAKWSKPVVESVIIPAHAQTSPSLVLRVVAGGGGSGDSATS